MIIETTVTLTPWLVFSVTPLKTDHNKNHDQNRSIDKVQNDGK